ncbi:MAG: hypothetical protein LBI60_02810 [Bacteroidales bacterium]|jgi:hypothetical protein|nr:hypothetical protein [Bacteroidales bacterium]
MKTISKFMAKMLMIAAFATASASCSEDDNDNGLIAGGCLASLIISTTMGSRIMSKRRE